MTTTETLEDFYQYKFNWLPQNLQQDLGHFNVFPLKDHKSSPRAPGQYSRRGFYKISLLRGHNVYHYADKSVEIHGTTMVFFNPQVPYTWEPISAHVNGFFCVFREGFFASASQNWLHQLPMFKPGGMPAYVLSESQFAQVGQLYEKMLTEINSDYPYKYDLIRNYVSELIHYALKLQPSDTLYQHTDAKSRLAAVFTELLERQFPIETPTQRFLLRSASDYAQQLAVHVNYLNRSVRTATGKTTSDHIVERVILEAKALLRHTDWNVAQISYSLGFDEPAHFNHFFKKNALQTPSAYRKV